MIFMKPLSDIVCPLGYFAVFYKIQENGKKLHVQLSQCLRYKYMMVVNTSPLGRKYGHCEFFIIYI